MSDLSKSELADLTAEVVSAYVSRNSLPVAELPTVLQTVFEMVSKLTIGTVAEDAKVEPPVPAVPIKKSITDDYIISLENGQKFKSLRRHLMTAYNMTPEQYRAKWGLPATYPMVAPNYAKSRSALAKTLGLGRKAASPPPEPVVEAKAEPIKVAAKRTRREPKVDDTASETGKKPRKPRAPKAA